MISGFRRAAVLVMEACGGWTSTRRRSRMVSRGKMEGGCPGPQQIKVQKNLAKEERKADAEADLEKDFLRELDRCGESVSQSGLRKRLGWYEGNFTRVVQRLVDRGVIEEFEGAVTAGKGATKAATVLRRKDHRS